mgnify:CR=1 FL=1
MWRFAPPPPPPVDVQLMGYAEWVSVHCSYASGRKGGKEVFALGVSKVMVCSHLFELEAALLASGAAETFRGKAWSRNCREWVCFDVVLDIKALQSRFSFAPSVQVHENLDLRSG